MWSRFISKNKAVEENRNINNFSTLKNENMVLISTYSTNKYDYFFTNIGNFYIENFDEKLRLRNDKEVSVEVELKHSLPMLNKITIKTK